MDIPIHLVTTEIIRCPIGSREITDQLSNSCGHFLRIGCIASEQFSFVTASWHIIACKLHKISCSFLIIFGNGKFCWSRILCWILCKLYLIGLACLCLLYLETQLTGRDTIKRIVGRLQIQCLIT